MSFKGSTASVAEAGATLQNRVRNTQRPQLMRWVFASILATIAATVVLVMRIGPVVAVIAPGRGIHTGDALGLLAALGSMALAAPMVLRWGQHAPSLHTSRRD